MTFIFTEIFPATVAPFAGWPLGGVGGGRRIRRRADGQTGTGPQGVTASGRRKQTACFLGLRVGRGVKWGADNPSGHDFNRGEGLLALLDESLKLGNGELGERAIGEGRLGRFP